MDYDYFLARVENGIIESWKHSFSNEISVADYRYTCYYLLRDNGRKLKFPTFDETVRGLAGRIIQSGLDRISLTLVSVFEENGKPRCFERPMSTESFYFSVIRKYCKEMDSISSPMKFINYKIHPQLIDGLEDEFKSVITFMFFAKVPCYKAEFSEEWLSRDDILKGYDGDIRKAFHAFVKPDWRPITEAVRIQPLDMDDPAYDVR